MKQAEIKINKIYNSGVETVVRDNDFRSSLLKTILFSFAALAVVYLLVLGSTVWNIAERNGLELEARSLASEVADLELSHLSLASQIDLDFSYKLGFRNVKQDFAVRRPIGMNTVSLRHISNEI